MTSHNLSIVSTYTYHTALQYNGELCFTSQVSTKPDLNKKSL